jgi:nicotinamide phosphoribosyltransferase
MNPLTCIDFYKADHRRQYPKGTNLVYSNLTPRSDRLKCIPDDIWTGRVTFFGLQYFIKKFLIEDWNKWFNLPKHKALSDYKRRMDFALGLDSIPIDHIEQLHDLGYLPILIKALPEGTNVPIRVPVLTIENTKPDFFWLTNYLETIMSCYLWKPTTSATIATHYKLYLDKMADLSGDPNFVKFQGHDFSFRGMSTFEDAALSGAGHLLSFVGTDTIPAIDLLEEYYGANVETELVGCSVPATEHSCMCMGSKENELETFRRLIEDIYPTGIVSIVSDTWDFWKVITEYSVMLKDKILNRNGKTVYRPDSGDPVKIICGDQDANPETPAFKGAMQILWDIFGGTINDKGYKVLDSHVGLIYGDSITFERAKQILQGLVKQGFASTNIVFRYVMERYRVSLFFYVIAEFFE